MVCRVQMCQFCALGAVGKEHIDTDEGRQPVDQWGIRSSWTAERSG